MISNMPPFYTVTLPRLQALMEFGTLIQWAKKEGERIECKELLVEIETDCKACVPLESPTAGYVAKILRGNGSVDVPIGEVLCIIAEDLNGLRQVKSNSLTISDLKRLAIKAF